MTQVSKYRLLPEVWDKIFNLFVDTIVSIKDKKKLTAFVNDFFSPTEKIVYAKRLAIAVLLAKGNDYNTIKNLIRVTPATIAKVNTQLKYTGQGLRPVVVDVLKRDAMKIFWEELQGLLDMPIKGQGLGQYHKRSSEREKKISRVKSGLG